MQTFIGSEFIVKSINKCDFQKRSAFAIVLAEGKLNFTAYGFDKKLFPAIYKIRIGDSVVLQGRIVTSNEKHGCFIDLSYIAPMVLAKGFKNRPLHSNNSQVNIKNSRDYSDHDFDDDYNIDIDNEFEV